MREKIKRPIPLSEARKKIGLVDIGDQQYALPGALIKVLGSQLHITLFDVSNQGYPETTFITESPFTHEANGKLYSIQADGQQIQVEEEATLIRAIHTEDTEDGGR